MGEREASLFPCSNKLVRAVEPWSTVALNTVRRLKEMSSTRRLGRSENWLDSRRESRLRLVEE